MSVGVEVLGEQGVQVTPKPRAPRRAHELDVLLRHRSGVSRAERHFTQRRSAELLALRGLENGRGRRRSDDFLSLFEKKASSDALGGREGVRSAAGCEARHRS